MGLRLKTVVFDVADLHRATTFWAAAVGYEVTSKGDAWMTLEDPKKQGPALGFQPRDDAKRGINHVHLDLAAADVEAEVRRLEKLGAKRATWPYYPPEADWVVLQDPDGNEFCVVPA